MTFQYYGPLDPDSRLYQHRMGVATNDGQEIPDLSKFIENACLDAAIDGVKSYFTINGSRQSGKTSTLLDLSQRIKAAGGYPCWLDFQRAYGATPEQSINFTARKILRAIPELGASVKIPDKFEYDGLGFDHWLLELPIPEKKPVVLLIEELGALPIDTRKFLGGLLRGAYMERRDTPWDKVVLVLFGGIELYDMISIEVSPFFNICMNISLLDLNACDTRILVGSGFDKVGDSDAKHLDGLCQSIHALVSGHPYLTQYLGDKALDHYKKNGDLPDDIQSVLSQLNVENSEYFHYLHKSIQKYDLMEVTKSLLQKPIQIYPDENALRRLGLLGVLGQSTETSHSFRNRLIQVSLEKILFSDQKQEAQITPTDDLDIEKETHLIRENMIQGLLERLFDLTCMQTAESRRNLLIKSGIEGLQPRLDVKGSVNEVVTRLFYNLENQPRLNNGYHPLGLFLTGVKALLSLGEQENVNLIDTFIDQYGLMESKVGLTSKNERSVFISYAWGDESERTVDELEQAFAGHGIRIVRDKKDLGYKGSIKKFEQQIGKGQYIILVISDKYLRSEHCMYELVEIDANQDFRKRIFPIMLSDANIYDPNNRLLYIKFWDGKIAKLDKKIKKMPLMTNLNGIHANLNKYAHIRAKFDDLINLISDMNTLTPKMLAASDFATLISAIDTAQA